MLTQFRVFARVQFREVAIAPYLTRGGLLMGDPPWAILFITPTILRIYHGGGGRWDIRSVTAYSSVWYATALESSASML